MGICQSAEELKAKEVSKKIERQLSFEAKHYCQKLLLLGPAESGKSTCVKQMQILHLDGFTEFELEERKCVVYSNTVRSMFELTMALHELGLEYEDSTLENDARILSNFIANGLEFCSFSAPVKLALQKLWLDPAIKESYRRRADFHIHDSCSYFFDNIERISERDYMPSNQDVLMTRMPTTGVCRLSFTLKDIEFNVYDVGGQRSERRKWIHCFDNVNAIIFIAAISEYDQRLREDNKTNRLIEAFELFDGIANSKFFIKTSMILFLNKKDLFEEKIKRISLSILFPTYKGGLNYEEGVAYLRRKFRKLYKNRQKLYIHETFATDTDQISKVFASVLDTIMQENMADTGML